MSMNIHLFPRSDWDVKAVECAGIPHLEIKSKYGSESLVLFFGAGSLHDLEGAARFLNSAMKNPFTPELDTPQEIEF